MQVPGQPYMPAACAQRRPCGPSQSWTQPSTGGSHPSSSGRTPSIRRRRLSGSSGRPEAGGCCSKCRSAPSPPENEPHERWVIWVWVLVILCCEKRDRGREEERKGGGILEVPVRAGNNRVRSDAKREKAWPPCSPGLTTTRNTLSFCCAGNLDCCKLNLCRI